MEIHAGEGKQVRERGPLPKKPITPLPPKPIVVNSVLNEIRAFEPREPKRIKVSHLFTDKNYLNYIIVPTGYMYNRDIQQARKQDTLVFADKTEAWIYQVCTMPLHSTIIDCLCRKRYGIPVSKVLQVWQDGLKAKKQDIKTISETECLVVFYEKKEKRRRSV